MYHGTLLQRARQGSLLLATLLLTMAVAQAADPLPRARAEAVGMSSERLARLTPALKAYTDGGKVAGSVALVARRGKLVYYEAFGQRDREAGSPMRTDSVFRIASQTKAVVTTAAMMLVEQGKLSLTDPVSKFIPEFRDTRVAVARPNGAPGYDVITTRRQITVRDLMTHTSGLSYGNGPAAEEWKKAGIQGYYFADRDEPIADTVARMAKLPLDAQPGERWIYGYSIDVLGVVVEKASGMPLDQLMRTYLIQPLGMTDTAFYLPVEKRERFAAVYASDGKGGIVRAPDAGAAGQGMYVDGPRKSFSAGAGFTSTAGDYARFLQMLLDGGRFGGQRLLSRKTVELMTSNHLGSIPYQPGSGFGLGFSVLENVGARGTPGSVGEFGWGGAYHSTYWVDPREQLVVVYLTQLTPTGNVDDFDKLRALIYQAIAD